MKKSNLIPVGLLFVVILMIAGCKGTSTPTPTPEKTIAELLPGKKWTVNIVTENGAEVYNKSKTTQVKDGYKNFSLDLTSTSPKLTEVDGTISTGTSYTFSATANTLTLTGLNPPLTGTTGTIVYDVSKVSDTNLVFSRQDASTKTGGTKNVYNLVNP